MGTSTGGPQALQEILPELPGDFPVAVIVVQHMPPGFTAPLAKRLNTISAVEVREAEHGDIVEPGNVYIAPAGRHLRVRRRPEAKGILQTKICLSDHPVASVHKPSADVMMVSIAEAFGKYCLRHHPDRYGRRRLAGHDCDQSCRRAHHRARRGHQRGLWNASSLRRTRSPAQGRFPAANAGADFTGSSLQTQKLSSMDLRYLARDSRVCSGSTTSLRVPAGTEIRNGVCSPSAKIRFRKMFRPPTEA